MKGQARRILLVHGALIFVIGLLLGIPFSGAILSGESADVVRAWRVAHTGTMMAGLVILVIGKVVEDLELKPGALRALAFMQIAAGWASVMALTIAATAGVRGLAPVGPTANWIAFAGTATMGVLSIASGVLVAAGAIAAYRN